LVVAGGCYFLGGFGRLFATEQQVAQQGFDSIIPSMLANLPDILIAIVLVLVLSASMSTLSSLVLTSSSTLTLDFILPIAKKEVTDKKKISIMRVFIAFFIVVSAVIAIVQAKSKVTFIAQLMGVSWGALAGAFLAPFLYGLYSKRATKASVAVSFVLGSGIMIVQLLISLGVFTVSGPILGFIFKNSLYSGVFAMLINLIIVPLVSLLTKNNRPDNVDELFSCYDKKVEVSAVTAISNKK